MNNKFKIGDKVLYIGEEYPELRGVTLTIKDTSAFDLFHYLVQRPDMAAIWKIGESQLILANASPVNPFNAPSPYTWTYYSGVALDESADISIPSDAGIVFTKEIPGNFKLECQCGTAKVYGENAASDMHSTYCPLYRKG